MIPYKNLTPSHGFPFVTILLISANLAVFIYYVLLPKTLEMDFIYQYAVIPHELKIANIFSIFTAMFLHGGWFHILGNMLYLWIFGENVEGQMGPKRFLSFYLTCGALATIAQIYANVDSRIPAVGASGAIAGILAAHFKLFPRGKIAVLVPVFYFLRTMVIPAWLMIGFWVLLQILEVSQSSARSETGGVAYFAHLGGFIAGFLLMPVFLKKN